MSDGFLVRRGGSGGTELNYSVVGGTTQPTGAGENTVWVNTSTAISSHVFSSTQPSSPSAGMVWFNVGASSPAEMNILPEGNKIMVYPVGCMQYVSGAWVVKTARTYQKGAWVDWLTYLYIKGDLCEDLTGGWATKATGIGEGGAVAPTVTEGSSALTITQATATSGGIAYLANKINLSGYSTLAVKATCTNMNTITKLYVWSALGSTQSVNATKSVLLTDDSSEITLDVSSLTGSYYIGFGLYSYTGKLASVKMTEMSLAK